MDVREVRVPGWERVLVARENGYHGIVAVHSTALGTALGGTRLWRYPSEAAVATSIPHPETRFTDSLEIDGGDHASRPQPGCHSRGTSSAVTTRSSDTRTPTEEPGTRRPCKRDERCRSALRTLVPNGSEVAVGQIFAAVDDVLEGFRRYARKLNSEARHPQTSR